MVPMARILVVGVVFIAAPCAFAELKPTRQPISANAAAETNFMLSHLCMSQERQGRSPWFRMLSGASHRGDWDRASPVFRPSYDARMSLTKSAADFRSVTISLPGTVAGSIPLSVQISQVMKVFIDTGNAKVYCFIS